MSCDPCAHADEHGWWGPKHPGTHCRTCHRSWTSLIAAHCVRCHHHFTNSDAADRHLRNGKCQDPLELRNKKGEPVLMVSTRQGRYPGLTFTQYRSDSWSFPTLSEA